jgi:hypothetical protein
VSKSNRVALSVLIPLLTIIACAVPGITTPDTTSISTSAAQTVIAGFTQNASSATLPPAFETPISTSTPALPTLTPTQTFTATLSVTFTPLVPQISVSVPTNCRNGPGKVYGLEGALLVGEIAQIHGRDPTGKYWYIPNPNKKGQFCWVWGEYANLSGNTGFLPVYTPPPTPTPTLTPTPAPVFEAEYSSLDTCTGWWVEFILRNTGSVRFQSAGIIVKDTVTKVTLSNLTDGFVDVNGCLTTNTRDALGPKKTTIISAPAFTYDPTGHKIIATITLCSKTGQNGTCVTRKIKFTP